MCSLAEPIRSQWTERRCSVLLFLLYETAWSRAPAGQDKAGNTSLCFVLLVFSLCFQKVIGPSASFCSREMCVPGHRRQRGIWALVLGGLTPGIGGETLATLGAGRTREEEKQTQD